MNSSNKNQSKAFLIDSLIVENLAAKYPCSSYLLNEYLNYYDYGILLGESSKNLTNFEQNINEALIDFQGNFL